MSGLKPTTARILLTGGWFVMQDARPRLLVPCTLDSFERPLLERRQALQGVAREWLSMPNILEQFETDVRCWDCL